VENNASYTPGSPGLPPRWTSSAKSGVGTALDFSSAVWFTLSHGILNEIYYPRIDQACTRDMGLIVTDSSGFFSEEKRHTHSKVTWAAPGVPAFRVENVCEQGRYRIEKFFVTDTMRPVVLQRTRFEALVPGDYRLHVILAPHLGNRGTGNTAWLGDHKGTPMLFAERDGRALALACSAPWRTRSVGFAGASDGWSDLKQNGHLTSTWSRAENGNIALTAEIDWQATNNHFALAIGFGRTTMEAAHQAATSIANGFDLVSSRYVAGWTAWQDERLPLDPAKEHERELYRRSIAVMRIHEAKDFPGGCIASLSIPWGSEKGDDNLGGYHLVWPRDMVETAGGLVAANAHQQIRRILVFLQVTQEADGHWAQNMWLEGTPYWNGVQMDETALVILLLDLARRHGILTNGDLANFWPTVRRAAAFLVLNGPVTQEDRWEEDAGYSPFTLGAEIAALLAAADLAEKYESAQLAQYLRETADTWNANIESWIYASGTELASELGIDGYYVRIASADEGDDDVSPLRSKVIIKNRPVSESVICAADMVSPDALALVRFGLRAADDPRIVDTVKVIDHLLKVETPHGPVWRRYNHDGYGEHEDGSAFDGTGIGRPWPLLTGERAHYELAAGRIEEAVRLKKALEAFASNGGMLPEQVWDTADIPGRELFFGGPTGSAMPLVWAHAEYVKLYRSLHDGSVFDMPPQTVERYQVQKVGSSHAVWRFNQKCRVILAGKTLRIETLAPARMHWGTNGWQNPRDVDTAPTGVGIHLVDLATEQLSSGATINFTFYWPDSDRWEGVDFNVSVVKPSDC
jgi:glucoamylase